MIDFGGGTFDVCIIETTKEGDIRIGGKHSKPIGASSIPVGGYFINQKIAEFLIIEYNEGKIPKKKIRTAINSYSDWRKGEKSLLDFEDFKNFINNFNELIYEIENAKIAICKSIDDWSLNSSSNLAVPISIPLDPFSINSRKIDAKITFENFKKIFLDDIWKPHLKPNIKRTFKRAMEELKSTKITIVLLSGGSANIGWLKELLISEFQENLGDLEIFPLRNYQEVVAQGLAIECARRFFTDDKQGDFSSVTYNRICLILNPDDNGYQVKPFKTKSKDLPNVQNFPGVLLPSASLLHQFIENPMKWKVKLTRRPSKKLEYRFLRSSFDPVDLENTLNIENYVVYTPPKISFDSTIQIELLVKENGTAYPKFIYKTGANDKIIEYKEGNPFPIDITTLQTGNTSAYLGFDFGTSNSSISFVDKNSIQLYKKRKQKAGWEDLTSLVDKIPYPLADSLANYLNQFNTNLIITKALEFLESSFSMICYISYNEFCVLKGGKKSKKFKGFTQRSIGPLWAFFKECIENLPKTKCIFSLDFKELIKPENFKVIDECVDKMVQHKHGKIDSSDINHVRPIQLVANVCKKAFDNNLFGYFENVTKQKFSNQYVGKFRKAHGRLPFIETFDYSGESTFSQDQPILLNISTDNVLQLQPLIFWDTCEKHRNLSEGHCYFYDKYNSKTELFSYKATGFNCSLDVSNENKYSELAKRLNEMNENDCKSNLLKPGRFKEIVLQ